MSDQRRQEAKDNLPQTSAERVPPLLRFLGLHLALGSAIAIAFVSLIILADIGSLKKLLVGAQNPFLPLLLLYGFNMITFASVAMGIGIMTMPLETSEATTEATFEAPTAAIKAQVQEPVRAPHREKPRPPESQPVLSRAGEPAPRGRRARIPERLLDH